MSGPVRVNRSVTFSFSLAPRYAHRMLRLLPLHRVNVGGLDDQRVAFPAADRIAQPRLVARIHVRLRVQADDARVVHHLAS